MLQRITRPDIVHRVRDVPRVHGALFSLSLFPLPEGRRGSFSCVVSKKVAGKSTERNAIKRLCREAVRSESRTFKKPLALMFRAKHAARNADFASVKQDVRDLLRRIAG